MSENESKVDVYNGIDMEFREELIKGCTEYNDMLEDLNKISDACQFVPKDTCVYKVFNDGKIYKEFKTDEELNEFLKTYVEEEEEELKSDC